MSSQSKTKAEIAYEEYQKSLDEYMAKTKGKIAPVEPGKTDTASVTASYTTSVYVDTEWPKTNAENPLGSTFIYTADKVEKAGETVTEWPKVAKFGGRSKKEVPLRDPFAPADDDEEMLTRDYNPSPGIEDSGSLEESLYSTPRLAELLDKFVTTGDRLYGIKALYGSRVIDTGSTIMTVEVRRRLPDVSIAKDYFKSSINSIFGGIIQSLKNIGIEFEESGQAIMILRELVEDLFISKTPKYHLMSIDTKELLGELIEFCSRKGIRIDEDIYHLSKVDFRSLRENSCYVKIAYISLIDSIVLLSDWMYEDIPTSGVSELYGAFPDIIKREEVVKEIVIKKDLVEINGEKYPVSVFESIVEMKLNDFLAQLRLETVIEDSAGC